MNTRSYLRTKAFSDGLGTGRDRPFHLANRKVEASFATRFRGSLIRSFFIVVCVLAFSTVFAVSLNFVLASAASADSEYRYPVLVDKMLLTSANGVTPLGDGTRQTSEYPTYIVGSAVGDHGDPGFNGGLQWTLEQIGNMNATIVLLRDRSYRFERNVSIPANVRLVVESGVVLRTSFAPDTASHFRWKPSAQGNHIYFLEPITRRLPSINKPCRVMQESSELVFREPEALQSGSWGWGDLDDLGYATLYVRLTRYADPRELPRSAIELGITFSLQGQIECSPVRLFEGYGNVVLWLKQGNEVLTEWFGSHGDGLSDDSAAIEATLKSIDHGSIVRFIAGKTYLTDGGHVIPKNDLTFLADGASFRKIGTSSHHMFLIQEKINFTMRGGDFNLSRHAFKPGQTVSAFQGVACRRLRFEGVDFRFGIENGLKFRDCGEVLVSRCHFIETANAGVEFANYPDSIYAGKPPALRPAIEGGHKVTECYFRGIDDGSKGARNGCAVYFGSANPHRPMKGVIASNNYFIDCQRSIWFESTVTPPCGTEDVVVSGNTIVGSVSQNCQTKDGIGLVSVRNATISDNFLLDIGNFSPVNLSGGPAECSGIVVSGSPNTVSQNVLITRNTIVDHREGPERTQFGIRITSGVDVHITDNLVGGCAVANVFIAKGAKVTVSGH